MQVRFSEELRKELVKIRRRDPKLIKRIEKQLALFIQDPTHISLRLHKLSGKLDNMWSISITRSIRMVYLLFDNDTYFVDIGIHDEVYKK